MAKMAMREELALTLLADAVASEVENSDSEHSPIPEDLRDEMRAHIIRPQEDIVEMVRDEAARCGLDLEKFLPVELIDEMADAFLKASGGKLTLADLYEEDEQAAHRFVMGAEGHGINADDDTHMAEWLKEQGVDLDKMHYLNFEGPHDQAYEFIQAWLAAYPAVSEATVEASGGYADCACPDCMEIAISDKGEPAFCNDCVKAGCDGEGECQAPGAYGVSDESIEATVEASDVGDLSDTAGSEDKHCVICGRPTEHQETDPEGNSEYVCADFMCGKQFRQASGPADDLSDIAEGSAAIWHIEDWAGNQPYDGTTFDSFEDAEEFLSQELGEKYETDRQEYEIVQASVTASRKITKPYMEDLLAENNKTYGTDFTLGGAYGNIELWSKGQDRLEAGSLKDCYNAFVKERFKEKHRNASYPVKEAAQASSSGNTVRAVVISGDKALVVSVSPIELQSLVTSAPSDKLHGDYVAVKAGQGLSVWDSVSHWTPLGKKDSVEKFSFDKLMTLLDGKPNAVQASPQDVVVVFVKDQPDLGIKSGDSFEVQETSDPLTLLLYGDEKEIEISPEKLRQLDDQGMLLEASLHTNNLNEELNRMGILTKAAVSEDDRKDFAGYCRKASDAQLHGILEKEQAGAERDPDREAYVEVCKTEMARRGITATVTATGEPDQDYDHAFFDAIVTELGQHGMGGSHREFDKYQGVYLDVTREGKRVGRFWVSGIETFNGPGGEEASDVEFTPDQMDVAVHVLVMPVGDQYVANVDDLLEFLKLPSGKGNEMDAAVLSAQSEHLDADEIPADWEVQPLQDGQEAKDRATCGHCGLSWDDGISTSMTPTPSARCPFESFHIHGDETDAAVTAMNKELRAEILEKLADLEHQQWVKWAEAVAPEVAPERAARWKNYFVPYDQLDEKTKKLDREWAEEVLLVIEPYLTQGAEKAVVYKVDAARYPGLSKILAADPSLQPPKKWFGEMQRDIKKSNPSYSDEQVRKTIGDIWYHNLSDAKRTEIREREGKHYGAA